MWDRKNAKYKDHLPHKKKKNQPKLKKVIFVLSVPKHQ